MRSQRSSDSRGKGSKSRRPPRGDGVGGGRTKKSGSAKSRGKVDAAAVTADPARREAELMRLNDELERQTTALATEADQVIRGQAEMLAAAMSSPAPADDDGLFSDYADGDGDGDNDAALGSAAEMLTGMLQRAEMAAGARSEAEADTEGRATGGVVASRPQSRRGEPRVDSAGASRPQSRRGEPRPGSAARSRPQSARTARTGSGRSGSWRSSRSAAAGTADAIGIDTAGDEALEAVLAGGMSADATARFLKAKIKVMQDEINELTAKLDSNESKTTEQAAQLRKLSTAQTKSQKTAKTASDLAEKYRSAAEEANRKWEHEAAQAKLLRKELEVLKRTKKQADGRQSTLEVRLQRATEEVEKLKADVRASRQPGSNAAGGSTRRIQELEAANKMLGQQKKELLSAFKKQLKLIDILKRQKLHIEAARVLQFSEEEFVKSMDWGAAQ